MRLAIRALAATVAILSLAGCHDVDSDRIPLAAVRIPFTTIGDWHAYGIAGAATSRRFIRETGSPTEPPGYPYTAMTATGYGGVLLVGTFSYSGDPQLTPPAAFDLSCPVEARRDIRVVADSDQGYARCPKCGSTYDIFQGNGMPLSGPAAQQRYGLRRYRVVGGTGSEYVVIVN